MVGIVNGFVSTVQDLVTEKEIEVHNSRLKFFSDRELNVTEELIKTIEHNNPLVFVTPTFRAWMCRRRTSVHVQNLNVHQ